MVNCRSHKLSKTCQGFVLMDAVVGLVLWGMVAHMAFPILSQLVRVHRQQVLYVQEYLARYQQALQASVMSTGDTIELCVDSNVKPPLYYGCWQQASDMSKNTILNK